jgi:hypothetical protein
MHKAVTENRSSLSLYSLKAALAKFPLSQAPQLLPSLRHPHPRIRLAASEILREMAKCDPAGKLALVQYKGVFDREFATLTSDADPEVRAIAAGVVAHLDDQAHGGSVTLVRNILRLEHSSFDMGYDNRMYGFAGRPRGVYMGFFNPTFYQVHQLAARLYGLLWGPVGYDFSGGMGIQ